ncbi:hypothetical protein K450DRAFT_229327 [Umbelopsis ramanniana AG]|uniref:Uncharacterized protein n=1 Tax=Umbelopsis ramanniana AG TaxID=1314678 RepID=A0AAD5HH26_UMBRA|nr:uncharacterized protein K450DRAFT_229327 [Umbelopsis ramanniana AG]KAI8582166.1 hypothetical protein K450DRAFT_229327 [Umbelopsis ramanniana AG]
MSIQLKGKAAFVTGGGTGLGAAVCELYAQEGMNLAIGYSRSSTDAEALAKRLSETYGIKAYTVQADLSKTGVAEKSVDEAYELLGGLDVLVNNAGMTKFCAFDDLDGLQEEDWDNILTVNTRSVFFTSRSALKYFVKNKDGGCIINTTSVAASRVVGSSIAYCTSKAGMSHVTRCLARAMGKDNVRVNGIAPGFLETRWQQGREKDARAAAAVSALQRTTSIEECAEPYVMLAKNASITGEIITVDAGLSVGTTVM